MRIYSAGTRAGMPGCRVGGEWEGSLSCDTRIRKCFLRSHSRDASAGLWGAFLLLFQPPWTVSDALCTRSFLLPSARPFPQLPTTRTSTTTSIDDLPHASSPCGLPTPSSHLMHARLLFRNQQSEVPAQGNRSISKSTRSSISASKRETSSSTNPSCSNSRRQ